jgi:hypothetical protein
VGLPFLMVFVGPTACFLAAMVRRSLSDDVGYEVVTDLQHRCKQQVLVSTERRLISEAAGLFPAAFCDSRAPIGRYPRYRYRPVPG